MVDSLARLLTAATMENLMISVILPVLLVGVVLTFIRLLRGPRIPDRVVAMDLLAAIGICIIATYAIATEQPVFLDVGIVLALLSFLGTVAFAYYIDRRA